MIATVNALVGGSSGGVDPSKFRKLELFAASEAPYKDDDAQGFELPLMEELRTKSMEELEADSVQKLELSTWNDGSMTAVQIKTPSGKAYPHAGYIHRTANWETFDFEEKPGLRKLRIISAGGFYFHGIEFMDSYGRVLKKIQPCYEGNWQDEVSMNEGEIVVGVYGEVFTKDHEERIKSLGLILVQK